MQLLIPLAITGIKSEDAQHASVLLLPLSEKPSDRKGFHA